MIETNEAKLTIESQVRINTCKKIANLIEKVFDLEYNGAKVCTSSKDNYISPETWEERFQEREFPNIVWKALHYAIKEDEFLKENECSGLFLSRKGEYEDSGYQMLYYLNKDNIEYLISLIFKWDCRNWYVLEYDILTFEGKRLGEFGMNYYIDFLYKVNWSKINLPLCIHNSKDRILYLSTNDLVCPSRIGLIDETAEIQEER